MPLQKPLEAALIVKKGTDICLLGGRENKDDSKIIWKIDLEDCDDISEVQKIGSLKNRRCLHKGIITDKLIIIFGGIDISKTEVLNRDDFSQNVTVSTKSLVRCLKSVSLNETCLKRTGIA